MDLGFLVLGGDEVCRLVPDYLVVLLLLFDVVLDAVQLVDEVQFLLALPALLPLVVHPVVVHSHLLQQDVLHH